MPCKFDKPENFNEFTNFSPQEGMQYTLEKKFFVGQKRYLFSRENYSFKYSISFDMMEQVNLDTFKTRQVLRRPLFVLSENVKNKTL